MSDNPGLTGLMEWWSLEEGTGANRVGSHKGHVLTNYGSVLQAAGVVGNCADFEVTGGDDALYMADHADFSFGDESFTVGAWVKNEQAPANRYGIITKMGSTSTREWELIDSGVGVNQPRFLISPDGSASVTVDWSSTVGNGTWRLWVGMHDHVNDLIGISINGAAYVTAAHATGCNNNNSELNIGADLNHSNNFLDGAIDEAFVYRGRVLTQAQLTWLYNSGSGRSYAEVAQTEGGGGGGFFSDNMFTSFFKRDNGLYEPKRKIFIPSLKQIRNYGFAS